MRIAFVASFALASLALTSCGSDTTRSPQQSVGRSVAPVIHGELDTGTTHDEVVYISFQISATEGGACSGTLIAPNVVVTARHCVSQIDESVYPPRAGADFDMKTMGVFLHTDPTGSSITHAPDANVIKIVHDSATSLGDHDFAMIVLDRAVSTQYSQIRLASAPTAGEGVFVVGYGITDTDGAHPPDPHQRYWRDGLSILEVGPTSDGFAGANEIILGESICEGDSGGPVKDHGTTALLAVTSRGGNGSGPSTTYPAQPCVGSGTYNLFTRVDAFSSLIKSTLAAYGEIPWEEGAPKPPDPTTPPPAGALGSPCTTGSDCKTGICVDADGSMVCSSHCSASEPCPSGFDCASGYCVPSGSPPPPADDAGTPPPGDDAGTPPGDNPTPDANATDDTKGGCAMGSTTTTNASAFAVLALAGLALVRRRRR